MHSHHATATTLQHHHCRRMSLLARRLIARTRLHTLSRAALSHKLLTPAYHRIRFAPNYLASSHLHTTTTRIMSTNVIEKDVGSTGDFKLNIPTEVEIGEIKAIVVKTEDGLFALGNKCTHYGAPLSKGIVAGGRVKCPWHGACFRVATGDIEEAPAPAALPTYTVRTEGDRVFVSADQNSEAAKNSKVLAPSAVGGSAQSTGNATHKPIKETENQHFVVVGGGSGGQSTVDSLREFGFLGKLTLVSAEKTLPYDRTKLSKQPMVDKSSIAIRDSQYYEQRKIDVHLGTEVKSIDPPGNSITLSNGNTLKYDKLFIATGGSPVTGLFEGDDLQHVYTLRNPDDADKIIEAVKSKPKCKVHVVGSGWIGVELAGALQTQLNDKKLDIDSVTVINMQDMPFKAVVGERIGKEIQKWHESKGVKFLTETKTKKLEAGQNGAVGKVHIEDKDGKASVLETDVVIAAVGVKPNTAFLKQAQGIELEEKSNAVYVNENLQTSVRNIYAYGDIAKFPYDKITQPEAIRIEHWNVAMQHGRIASAHALNNESVQIRTTHSYIPWFWSMQYGNSIRYVGHSEKYDDIIYSGTVEGEHKFIAYYVQGDVVEAMLTWQRDPAAAAGSELFMRKLMPTASELRKNPDIDLQELLKSKASNSTKEPQPK